MLKEFKGQLEKTIKSTQKGPYKALISHLTDQMSEEDAHHFDQNIYNNLMETHWELSHDRPAGEARIKVHAPCMEGSQRRKTVIDIVSDDVAFVVDSVAATINQHKYLIELLVHPVLNTVYDDKGELSEILPEGDDVKDNDKVRRQSYIHVHVHENLSDEAAEALKEDLLSTIADVRVANRDWKTMLVRLKEASAALEISKTERPQSVVSEYCAFLDYLHQNNFTLLGYAEYKFDGKGGSEKVSSLGVLSNGTYASKVDEDFEGFPLALQEIKGTLPPVTIAKSKTVTSVHRRVPMDVISVKLYDDAGKVIGEKIFLGLFTSVTYSRSVKDIPYLRLKVSKIMEMSDHVSGSHDYKALRHILEKYPRDELFQTETKALYATCSNILRLQERQRIALFTRKDVFGSYISCMVYVPRERFGTSLRKKIVRLLENELGGTCGSFFTSMDDSLFARGLFRIDVDPSKPLKFKHATIEEKLQELGQSWAERISYALEESQYPEGELASMTLKYGEAFPVNYMNSHSAKKALFDIEKIETALQAGKLQLDLYKPDNLEPHQLRLKIYNSGKPIVLSDVMPILDDLGLRAISELPYEVTPMGVDKSLWIHDFLLEHPDHDQAIDLEEVKEHFEEAFSRIWYNEMESDRLNRLVLSAQMSWRDIVILRCYVKYMRQARVPHSQHYIQRTLTKNATISKDLVALFRARLNPERSKKWEADSKKIVDEIVAKLQAVESLNQDRVIRILKSIVLATLRTNFYQRAENGDFKDYVSLKLDSKAISVLPNPKPFREIFVYSTKVEGVHLRGDKIARGGLRWSDRHEDFRTEVLGLMKAQMVKNSVIVPMGSKGGFVVKIPTKTRDEFREAGVACYKTFIRGLLDITDNLEGDKVIPPKQTVRIDSDDPYLVVAADKGTATFSDIANGLAQDYGFWLDDAFASGGSAGYDHKKMGITARGAWESVKLHFRQMDHNTQTTPFDVIGVGDMGGDVFGNGMLLSEHIRLVGAFNHLHIFCDPDPDVAATYKERKRLFDKVCGWDEYDETLLSKGGRIYSRSEKSLKLTPQIKARFGIEEDEVPPEVLMKAMLQSKVDLLWFGGIGTYIKATEETNADVGDKANDALRVDAKTLQARVIGEGANLGVTQLGRIEYSKYGGRINTDFIDNSGGVDSSDHEVNIKILLSAVMKAKGSKMDLKARNELLEAMTKDIENHVLRHNYQQAQAVSLAEAQASENLQLHDEFIQDMEREEGLDRKIEFLPNADEIQKRLTERHGLTRPELSVLISYAKIALTKDLLKSSIPDDPNMQIWLYDYFPAQLREAYKKEINEHKLRREIVAMAVANSLINRLGPTFIQATMKKTGMGCHDIVKAYISTREIFGLRKLWDDLEALDNQIPSHVQIKGMVEMAKLSEFAITWFLTRRRDDLDVAANIQAYRDSVQKINHDLSALSSDNLEEALKEKASSYMVEGLPEELAKDLAALPVLQSALDITQISKETGSKIEKVAHVYFALGQRFQIDWLHARAAEKEYFDSWDREATEAIIDKLYVCQAGLTARILNDSTAYKCKEGDELTAWVESHNALLQQVDPLFKKLRRAGAMDLAMLMVAEQRLRHLYGG